MEWRTPSGYQGDLHGLQLWVAQPERTRHGPPAFEHHDDLPRIALGDAQATVLVGELGGVSSPARTDTPLVGVELSLRSGSAELPLRPDFEYAVIVLAGGLTVGQTRVEPGSLGYLGKGRDELRVGADEPTKAMLIGGVPFEAPVLMWWNFVARSRQEIDAAAADWRSGGDDRFGVVSFPLGRVDAPSSAWGAAR